MSSGAFHFREAERLLDDKPRVADWLNEPEAAEEHWRLTLSAAQVHATLALAAATALPADYVGSQDARVKDWIEATS